MNQENPEEELQTQIRGGVAFVTLNRPKVLNALSLEMIRALSACLRRWEKDKDIRAIFIRGAGGKAFSAGGDVRAFYKAGMDYRRGNVSLKVPTVYFAEEYSLNRQIFHYSKPIIAFMNGITMGGGYGIAGNSKYRIATANTVFAMPETKIGFFPDVGSVYHLLRAPSHLGWYLALTGNALGAPDLISSGLADYYIAPEREAEFLKALEAGGEIEKTIQNFNSKAPGDYVVTARLAQVEKIFGAKDVSGIIAALEKDGSPWASETLGAIAQRSPMSVKVTAEYLRRMQGQGFDEVLNTDFVLVQRFLQGFDLYEGIRAVIIEKDNAPHWNPRRFEDVSENTVKEYFIPTGYDLNDVQIFAA